MHLLLRRFGDGTESNLQLLHHSRGTITYCSPMLENTIHRSSTAQWAKSERCFGTHRRLRLLRPQHWWVTPFIQFCQWHSRRHFAEGPLMKSRYTNGEPHLKNWICVAAFKNMKTQNQLPLTVSPLHSLNSKPPAAVHCLLSLRDC